VDSSLLHRYCSWLLTLSSLASLAFYSKISYENTIKPTADASHVLQLGREDGFDYVTTTLPHSLDPRSDATGLQGRWWRTSVVGVVPETSSIETFLDRLSVQIEWATHMGIPAVILPLPPSGPQNQHDLMEYARLLHILAIDARESNVQVWIKTLLSDHSLSDFDTLHRLCDGACNIGMMICIEQMPSGISGSAAATVASQIILLHKAIGSQLKAISLPTKIFLTNKRGYPTLAKSHQVLVTEVFKRLGRTIRLLVDGPSAHDIPGGEGMGASKCLTYLQYIRHLRKRPECVAALDTEAAQMEQPYLDSLQRPLQPLKDHLEFSMYETFEKDPVKYSKYQEAIYMALKDGVSSMSSGPRVVTIVVAGAGRGPIVMRAIQAFLQLQLVPAIGVRLRVYALEKNPSAVVYLESMARHDQEWKDVVTVVHTDIRHLTLNQLEGNKIDIVVSELLGSFGDNELSPECLDPLFASECVKASTVSIPMQYTAYLAPVSSKRLHSDARLQAQVPHDGGQALGIQRAMETPYVVRTHAASQTHAEQACWVFQHPTGNPSKERAATLEFAPDATFGAAYGSGYGPVDTAIASIVQQTPVGETLGSIAVHGFLGTFTAILYARDSQVCEISVAPHRFSKGMFSWFPLFFPFRDPLLVPAGSNVTAKIWRKTKNDRVWYEWCAQVHRKGEVLSVTPIHNPNGRSNYVSM
jgi:type II protein arginine methyltransferase